MQKKRLFSTDASLDCIRAGFHPPIGRFQRDLPRLARRPYDPINRRPAARQFDAWRALTPARRWRVVERCSSIDSADVHGSATQRFAVLMDAGRPSPDPAAAVRGALRRILDEHRGGQPFGEVGSPAIGASCRSLATGHVR